MNKEVSIKDLESVSYFSNEDLVDVVNAAIFLKKPLLIEGPAGTGKTFLAKAISSLFNLELIRLQCHEGIDEDKAVYEWNYKKQLLSIQQDKNAENLFDEKYLIKRPILNALTAEKDSLFLIDEIDRSDEEFEALLLEILAENQVTIPEFGTINGNDNRITILTSNGTRELSDALKRRCIYFYLDFPSIDIESKVLMNSIEEISEAQAKSYASFISFVRKLNLNKIPSLIESVEWVKYNFLNKNKSTIDNLGVLLKDKSDQEKYKEQIENANELIQE
ncbi:MAG: MoxR family ATPase [Actinomycetota bacterium]|jgi:MoxR-like ATPase|nr:MoxR family ATPase [Acidimicrobiaceae bacterium]MDC2977399.1 MoxR family ATPase [Acidimicrobiaceae bacterium]MEC8328917.1 MoxR family ATPase [Actinomycetota bacterium]GIS37970.1 MAG: ATPase [Actinomycetota bacterium]|tara:strand:- start:739 stop:1569 length:831 start_codon:yes stop_codon:yes gene_type:complete